jgi:hypothetical protein
MRIFPLPCRSANDGPNPSEQIGAPSRPKATGDLAVCGRRTLFPRAGAVVRRSIGVLQENEQVTAQLAATFPQSPAMRIGGRQHHDRV